jgi:hypothetical protein
MHITIELPEDTKLGDLTTVAGHLVEASTEHVDWEALHFGQPGAVGTPAVILLRIADQIKRHKTAGPLDPAEA